MIINKNRTITKSLEKNNNWYIINAADYTLGRLASKVAYVLKNKNEVKYLPYKTDNQKIIIINSKKIKVTGKKKQQKTYKRHSGRPGGLKIETFEELQKRIPNKIIEKALKGMLPKNHLGNKLFKKVKIYSSDQHPYESKKPVQLNIN
uniref:Large ribosomal subunit protein uL13c n=1 Tax=Polysiphonia sertularioides TaxID=945028 RepID=A0A1Z1M8X5_9FLOR|nr:ribosomal protein L13 [Polysiphonia sertularioides]ARW62547.1 ribosomal protein L13 [Polysiphonia sertularioides]